MKLVLESGLGSLVALIYVTWTVHYGETAAICSGTRHHRNHRHALALRNAQNYSICPFRVVEDRDESRVPVLLEHVYCEPEGCRCTEDNAFSCLQLFTNIDIQYPAKDTKQTVRLYHGCICGNSKGMPAHLLHHYNVST